MMRAAHPMRVKQKVYTNNHKQNGLSKICKANLEGRGLDRQSPKKRKAPLLDHIPGLYHGCRLSPSEVA
jgi:hypothetical protein